MGVIRDPIRCRILKLIVSEVFVGVILVISLPNFAFENCTSGKWRVNGIMNREHVQ